MWREGGTGFITLEQFVPKLVFQLLDAQGYRGLSDV